MVLYSAFGMINILKKFPTENTLSACDRPAKAYLMAKMTEPNTTYGTINLRVFFQMNLPVQAFSITGFVRENRKPEIKKNNGMWKEYIHECRYDSFCWIIGSSNPLWPNTTNSMPQTERSAIRWLDFDIILYYSLTILRKG